jgi:hypothetical protein
MQHRDTTASDAAMTPTADKWIAAIRAKVREERGLLSELDTRVSADLKKALELASFLLDDVERFFLASEVPGHPKCSDSEMAQWFGHAEAFLVHAIRHRVWVEALIERFGPNARIVGD